MSDTTTSERDHAQSSYRAPGTRLAVGGLGNLLAACISLVLAGCVAVTPQHEVSTPIPDIDNTLEIMDRARVAGEQEWLQLHNLLAIAAVMNPLPIHRARVALVLAAGERSQDERARAEQLMDKLLDGDPEYPDPLPPAMRSLLHAQCDALRARRLDEERIADLKKASERRRELLSRESIAHARTRAERDQAKAALASAREQLRQVTRIELRHEAGGS